MKTTKHNHGLLFGGLVIMAIVALVSITALGYVIQENKILQEQLSNKQEKGPHGCSSGSGVVAFGGAGIACPEVYEPVCGADGTTYGNGCEAESSGISNYFPGECACPEIYEPVCGNDGETYSNECHAKRSGVTVLFPGPCGDICDQEYAPVCGSDGTTYYNSCHAEQQGITQYESGECVCTDEYAPVCGSNGQVYSNECQARAAGIYDFSEGVCIFSPEDALEAALVEINKAANADFPTGYTWNGETVNAPEQFGIQLTKYIHPNQRSMKVLVTNPLVFGNIKSYKVQAIDYSRDLSWFAEVQVTSGYQSEVMVTNPFIEGIVTVEAEGTRSESWGIEVVDPSFMEGDKIGLGSYTMMKQELEEHKGGLIRVYPDAICPRGVDNCGTSICDSAFVMCTSQVFSWEKVRE